MHRGNILTYLKAIPANQYILAKNWMLFIQFKPNFNQNFSLNAKFESVGSIKLCFTHHNLLWICGQKYSPNCMILVSKYKIFHLLRGGGTSPLRHPLVHIHNMAKFHPPMSLRCPKTDLFQLSTWQNETLTLKLGKLLGKDFTEDA